MQDVWKIICEKMIYLTIYDHLLQISRGASGTIVITTHHQSDPVQHTTSIAIPRGLHYILIEIALINNYPVFGQKIRYADIADLGKNIIAGYDLFDILANLPIIEIRKSDRSKHDPLNRSKHDVRCKQITYSITPTLQFPQTHPVMRCPISARLFTDVYTHRQYTLSTIYASPARITFTIFCNKDFDQTKYAFEFYLTRRGCKIEVTLFNSHTYVFASSNMRDCVDVTCADITNTIVRDMTYTEFAKHW